jgi:hypothetical protein
MAQDPGNNGEQAPDQQGENCTTFDDLTPDAKFERVVLDLKSGEFATSRVFLSFKEVISKPDAKVWFDLIDDRGYEGLRIRIIQSTNRQLTSTLSILSQYINEDKTTVPDMQLPLGYWPLLIPKLDLHLAPGVKVFDKSIRDIVTEQDPGERTYITQEEENASIIKSFEISAFMGSEPGARFELGQDDEDEHLSYFAFVYLDMEEVAAEYGIDINQDLDVYKFPYGQISFINVLGDYSLNPEVKSGPGRSLLCDFRNLRRFRTEASVDGIFKDTYSEIRNSVSGLIGLSKEETTRLLGERATTTLLGLSKEETNRLLGERGHFTELFHTKDQQDNIRFLFGMDLGTFASKNCVYPLLLGSNKLVEIATGNSESSVFELKDMRMRKIRLKDSSLLNTGLGGDTSLEIFSEDSDYSYVGAWGDFANPIRKEGKLRAIEAQIQRDTDTNKVSFFCGKDNLEKNPTEPGKYLYRIETTFLDHSPEIIKKLVSKLDRQVEIIRQAHMQIAGRHVFNDDFVRGEDKPGAIATRTTGGYFLKEEGSTLVSQREAFGNLRAVIEAPATTIAEIAEEIAIFAGITIWDTRITLRSFILSLLNTLNPDASGEVMSSLTEMADLGSYLSRQLRNSIKRALVEFTSDDYQGDLGSGTSANVVGGKRFIKDTHDFRSVVKNHKTHQTGIDLLSWWDTRGEGYGIKTYSYDFYTQRLEGEISKFYRNASRNQAHTFSNLWSYLTPAKINIAGRKPLSPYVFATNPNHDTYSYEKYADLQADLYDYKFNLSSIPKYEVHQPSYSGHDPNEDRSPPEHYTNKTITQLLNHHCEIEVDAVEKTYIIGEQENLPKYDPSSRSDGGHAGGLDQIMGAAANTADESLQSAAEASFGDNSSSGYFDNYKDTQTGMYGTVVQKEVVPMVTRIFYTLMGEMILTPHTGEYASAKFNSFAMVEDEVLPHEEEVSLPMQLRALTGMDKYRPNINGGESPTYKQPRIKSEPYTEILPERSISAIVKQQGNTVDFAEVYDIMKDHSKFAPFWYNFKHIYEVQFLSGYNGNIKEPIWTRLTSHGINFTSESKPILCRVQRYANQKYGAESLSSTALPIYNEYFFLEHDSGAYYSEALPSTSVSVDEQTTLPGGLTEHTHGYYFGAEATRDTTITSLRRAPATHNHPIRASGDREVAFWAPMRPNTEPNVRHTHYLRDDDG